MVKRLDYRFKQPNVLPAQADPKQQAAWVAPPVVSATTFAECGQRTPVLI
jgi:hypothetical protein